MSQKVARGAQGRWCWQSAEQEGSAPLVRGSLPTGSARWTAGALEMLPPLLGCLEAPKLPLGRALEAKKAFLSHVK